MPSYRVDWQRILTKLSGQGLAEDDLVLVALPVGGREIIASLIGERLEWEATYRTGDYQSNDWDALAAFGNQTHKGIWDGVMLSDLLTTLDEILAKIPSTGTFCCGKEGQPVADTGIEIDVANLPTTYAGTAVADWDDYKEWVCGAAYAYVDRMQEILGDLESTIDDNLLLIGGVGLVLALLSSVLLGPLIAIGLAGAVSLFIELSSFADGTILGDAVDEINAEEDDLANTIFCAGSAEQAAIDVRAWYAANLTTLPNAFVQLFDIERDMLMVYEGTDSAGTPLDITQSTACTCITPPEASGLYFRNIQNEPVMISTPYEITESTEMYYYHDYVFTGTYFNEAGTWDSYRGDWWIVDAPTTPIDLFDVNIILKLVENYETNGRFASGAVMPVMIWDDVGALVESSEEWIPAAPPTTPITVEGSKVILRGPHKDKDTQNTLPNLTEWTVRFEPVI